MLGRKYEDYLRLEKNYSDHTILAYTRDVQFFADFIRDNFELNVFLAVDVRRINHKLIRYWMGHLMDEGLSKRSTARKVASLNSYFRYLRKTGVLEENPAAKVNVPKSEKKLPAFLKDESIDLLFEGIEYPEDLEGKRDKCMLEVLYSCGLRRSELIGLQYHDIDFSNGTLKVLGKGRKERVVPFGSHARKAMKDYMAFCEKDGLNFRGNFFVKKDGNPIYARMVHSIVNKYLKQSCTLSKMSPHVLRHTFATHLLDRGADLNAIKELLGHSSLAATQVYVHNSLSKLKDIYSKAHPKA